MSSQTIVVPVLDNPYANQDKLVSLVLSNEQTIIPSGEPGQAILGTPNTATLNIVAINPNFTPLAVTNVQWTGTTKDIQEIFVTFNKPLIAATATDPLNFTLVNVGPDGKFGTLDDTQVSLESPSYGQSTWTVMLTPNQPLPANQFFHLQINGTRFRRSRGCGRKPLSGQRQHRGD